MPRDGSIILSDIRATSIEIACKRCGRFGRFNIKQLIIAAHGADAKLTDLLATLANCEKARSVSVHDRCKAVYGKDSRWSTSDSIKT